MRPACLDCARKHVAQAEALLHESRADPKYKTHYWLAIGHLAEAEAELMATWAHQAYYIREQRQQLMATPDYKFPTLSILEALCAEAEAVSSDRLSEEGGTSKNVLHPTLDHAGRATKRSAR